MGKKVKVDITYSWEVSEREWNSNKNFHESLEDNITWKAKEDPISVFHFLNNIDQPKDLRVAVERVDGE